MCSSECVCIYNQDNCFNFRKFPRGEKVREREREREDDEALGRTLKVHTINSSTCKARRGTSPHAALTTQHRETFYSSYLYINVIEVKLLYALWGQDVKPPYVQTADRSITQGRVKIEVQIRKFR
uniref:Uncharacterized protein n=1 Tax=Trichogramma kaykai TaxID=54128 RepID=A0ABD2XP40_9HYME